MSHICDISAPRVNLMNWKFTHSAEQQTKAFIDEFSEVIPLEWIQIFDEKELEVSTKLFLFLLLLFPVSSPNLPPLLSGYVMWYTRH